MFSRQLRLRGRQTATLPFPPLFFSYISSFSSCRNRSLVRSRIQTKKKKNRGHLTNCSVAIFLKKSFLNELTFLPISLFLKSDLEILWVSRLLAQQKKWKFSIVSSRGPRKLRAAVAGFGVGGRKWWRQQPAGARSKGLIDWSDLRYGPLVGASVSPDFHFNSFALLSTNRLRKVYRRILKLKIKLSRGLNLASLNLSLELKWQVEDKWWRWTSGWLNSQSQVSLAALKRQMTRSSRR